MSLRPLEGAGRAKRLAPFALGLALGFASLPLPPSEALAHKTALVVAGALTVLVAAAVALVPWRRLPPGVQLAPPLIVLVVVGLLRHAEGGAASGFAPLFVLPLLWVALYGDRAQLIATVLALCAVVTAPLLLVGGADYPAGEWRRVLLWLVAGPCVGVAVQQLVGRVRDYADTLAAVHQLARDSASAPDARQHICAAGRRLTAAVAISLLEPDGHGMLITTASAGPTVERLSVRVGREPSGAATAFESGEALLISDPWCDPAVSQRLIERTGARSVLFEPVMRGTDLVGVLVVCWRERTDHVDERAAAAVRLLATEAAGAIERADLVGRLTRLAEQDALTGLANRRVWDARVPDELKRAARDGRPLCVAMLDLDRFKAYNDRHGHAAGDELLAGAARLWAPQLRETDLLARYGGEEFAVLLRDCGAGEAASLLERVRSVTPGATCSVGVAEWDGVESAEALVQRADQALYAAKRAGRDRIAVHAGEPVAAPAAAP